MVGCMNPFLAFRCVKGCILKLFYCILCQFRYSPPHSTFPFMVIISHFLTFTSIILCCSWSIHFSMFFLNYLPLVLLIPFHGYIIHFYFFFLILPHIYLNIRILVALISWMCCLLVVQHSKIYPLIPVNFHRDCDSAFESTNHRSCGYFQKTWGYVATSFTVGTLLFYSREFNRMCLPLSRLVLELLVNKWS